MKVGCEMYSNTANRIIGSTLLAGINASTGLDTVAPAGSADQFYRDVAMSTISLVIPSVTTGYYSTLATQRQDALAWGILKGILELEGYHPVSAARFRVSSANGPPLAGVLVTLDETVNRYTDGNGLVDYMGLEKQGFTVTAPENPDAIISREP
jgi:hypothetical protein